MLRSKDFAAAALACALAAVPALPARALMAAAAKVDITPDLDRHRVYLAGYGAAGRRPNGVHDRLYARLLLLSDGHMTVGIVGLDLLGFYRNDVEDLRRLSGFDAAGRYLLVAATHQHAGPDTLGLWGPWIGKSGVDEGYHREIKAKIAEQLKALAPRLKPARLSAAEAELDPRGLCRDSRDPKVIDPYVRALAVRGEGGEAISTLVNWSCHPEVLDRDNMLLTADFPGPLCARVEEATGGECVYLSGAIGGLMTPDTVAAAGRFYESQRIGRRVAEAALAALRAPQVSAAAPKLEARSELPLVPVENSRYLLFLPALAFGHDLLDADGRRLPAWKAYWLALKHLVWRLDASQRPWVRTEVSLLSLGGVELLGIPGELFPELFLGGYDGRYRAGRDLITEGNGDPPDLAKAPKGPYLRDLMRPPVRLIAGLANDEIGYIVPAYDFKIRPSKSMLPRLPGHYEETNSIGPSATALVLESARRLLKD